MFVLPAGARAPGAADAARGRMVLDAHVVRNHMSDGDTLFAQLAQKEPAKPAGGDRGGRGGGKHAAGSREQIEAHWVRGQRDSVWRGAHDGRVPTDFSALDEADLRRFLLQAGVEIERFWQVGEMREQCRRCVGRWEVERVLACESAEQVTSSAQGGDLRGSGTPRPVVFVVLLPPCWSGVCACVLFWGCR